MAKIISHRTHTEIHTYYHVFRSKSKPYGWAGAMLECDAQGAFVHESHRAEFAKRTADPDQQYGGIEHFSRWQHDPAILQCDCKRKLELRGFTNTCECGADYNMSGSRLADRRQWGEETGESASDIINFDYEGSSDVSY